MKKMRTLLAVLLSFSLCVSLLVPAMAADGDNVTTGGETVNTDPVNTETDETTTEEHTHTHNSQVEDANKNVIGTWVCTVTYVNDGDCTLTPHTHSADCKDNPGFAIVCGLREHEHTDACYTEVEVEKEVVDADGNAVKETVTETKLTCECWFQEQSHTHSPSCYICDIPVHTHGENGAGCQFAQKAVWTCNYVEKEKDEVTENGKLPEKTPGNVSDKNNIYVYIEPDSIANYDPNGTANGHSYMTLARIEITAELLEKYNNGKETDNSLYIPSGTKSDNLSAEQFNALVNFALKNAGAKDKDGNIVSVDGKNVDNINWVYVKGSDGATDFVGCGNGTVHADGHAHKLEVVPNAEGDKSPTCTEGGYITYQCQKRIGTTYKLDGNQQPMRDENGNLVVETLGEVCGYTMKVYSAPLGHKFPAAWTDNEDGATHSHVCTECGEVDVTAAHHWDNPAWPDEWTKVDNTANQYTRTRTLTCSDCGATKDETQTKLDGQFIVSYVCKAGSETIGSGTVGAYYPGNPYEVTPPQIPGYETTATVVEGTMGNADVVVTFEYTAIDYTLTVIHSYRNADGVEVASQTVNSDTVYHYGDTYSTSSLARTGYVFRSTEGDAVSGTFGAKDITVTYVYGPAPVPTDPTPTTPIEEEVDEPEVPLVEEPPVEDIEEPEVPREEEPEIEIEEPDVPLAEVPETGDGSGLWFVSAVLSAMGLVLLFFTRKREDQEG